MNFFQHSGLQRRRRSKVLLPLSRPFLAAVVLLAVTGLLLLPPASVNTPPPSLMNGGAVMELNKTKSCATVEEMGQSFKDGPWKKSLRVRRIIRHHFLINGASRVRNLESEEFCRHGFVLGNSSEAGFGNEMYKILNAAALSIMLNRSLIIGQTRGKYPFGDYIAYSNQSFTLDEVKNLWRQNGCVEKYGRRLVMRIDDFLQPAKTNVLCSNWKKWEQPIIWFQNTTDAMASQFFLKNVHQDMRSAATELFGHPEQLQSRPNVFGELMALLVSPSPEVKAAVDMVLAGGPDPDISLHMRMLMNMPVRAVQAALNCVRKAVHNLPHKRKPRLVLVSDTPSVLRTLLRNISRFAEVLHFDYGSFHGTQGSGIFPPDDHGDSSQDLDFRVKDWGPAPRWVAFVDFFLAARAKHAVISGAHRRVGTTYAQLIAAFAAANQLGGAAMAGENRVHHPSFAFMSSFQSSLLSSRGLGLQIGWGHAWNRFGGPLSCVNQTVHQCAFTPLSPPAWWDGPWQSPIARDIRRLAMYGVNLSVYGTVDEDGLISHCASRKTTVGTLVLV